MENRCDDVCYVPTDYDFKAHEWFREEAYFTHLFHPRTFLKNTMANLKMFWLLYLGMAFFVCTHIIDVCTPHLLTVGPLTCEEIVGDRLRIDVCSKIVAMAMTPLYAVCVQFIGSTFQLIIATCDRCTMSAEDKLNDDRLYSAAKKANSK
jgi:hypothetical protein